MSENFDFIVVGGGSAGAVIASRLSEDPSCRVALIEAGERPPEVSAMPIAPAAMQLNPATDWMYTADPGKAGLGLNGRRMPVPRGKMLGGSSGINYMVYVRGHPGDFDSWAAGGATGWSYADVLPYFRKSEGLATSSDIVVDGAAHNTAGPLGVSVRDPLLPAARQFVDAAVAAGIPRGDYNGRDRGGPAGIVSLSQTTTRGGRRSSTYQAFLAGEPENRPNLTIITGAQATRVILDGEAGQIAATGVEYRTASGETATAHAGKEVILSAGAVGSPQLLLLSGVGPHQELEAVGVPCLINAPQRPGRAITRRPRRRPWPVRRTPGIKAGSAAASDRVAKNRAWTGRIIAGRCRGLLFDRSRRSAQPRYRDHVFCHRRQR